MAGEVPRRRLTKLLLLIYLKTAPIFRGLSDEPRYLELLENLGLREPRGGRNWAVGGILSASCARTN